MSYSLLGGTSVGSCWQTLKCVGIEGNGENEGRTADLLRSIDQLVVKSLFYSVSNLKQNQAKQNKKATRRKVCVRCSVMSDSLRPHGLHSPQNSPGQDTGVGSLSLLGRIFPTQGLKPGLPHCRWILYQLSHKKRWTFFGWAATDVTLNDLNDLHLLWNPIFLLQTRLYIVVTYALSLL